MDNHIRKICCILFLVLTGCGYRFGNGDLSERYRTISVPFAVGDKNGELTSEVVRQIAASGAFEYSQCDGSLILGIRILDYRDLNIGFNYDYNADDQLTKVVVPAETRTSVLAEITLTEASSGNLLIGPTRLTASVDYDHEYYSSRNGINVFSLGQLTDSYEAHDAMLHPLNIALAQKIVDYINNSW